MSVATCDCHQHRRDKEGLGKDGAQRGAREVFREGQRPGAAGLEGAWELLGCKEERWGEGGEAPAGLRRGSVIGNILRCGRTSTPLSENTLWGASLRWFPEERDGRAVLWEEGYGSRVLASDIRSRAVRTVQYSAVRYTQ